MASSQLKRPLNGTDGGVDRNSGHAKKQKATDGRGVGVEGNPRAGAHITNNPYRRNDFSHRPKSANQEPLGRSRHGYDANCSERHVVQTQQKFNKSSNKPRQPLPPLPEVKNPELSKLPFIHSSAVDGQTDWHSRCYEGLEWFGDSVLHFVATKVIAKDFDHFSAGQKSTLRETLVCNNTLREYSKRYMFPSKLVHATPGLEKSRKTWQKIEADIFEAYVGAVYQDDPVHGEDRIREWMLQLWMPILDENRRTESFQDVQDVSKAKTKLAALLGGVGIKISYEDVPHDKKDEMKQTVYLTGWGFEHLKMGTGVAKSKKNAGGAAALDAINSLNQLTPGGPGEQIAQALVTKRKFDAETKAQREQEEAEKAGAGNAGAKAGKSDGSKDSSNSDESEEE